MNVLYLASEPRIDMSKPVGHTTHILKTIRGLEKEGHNVYRIIAGERRGARRAKRRFGTIKAKLPPSVTILLRDLYTLAHDREFFYYCYSICQERTFDFIYERASVYHRTGQRLSEAIGIPLILEVNSPIEEMITYYGCSRIMIPIAASIEKSLALRAHAIVVGSAAMGRYLERKGVKSDKIFTIYPTAEDHAYQPPRHRTTIRRRFGIDDKTVVGFVGAMAGFHRVDILLQAAIKVSRFSNNIHFLIVGDGKKMASLENFVRENLLEEAVTFTGRVPYEEVHEYVGAMDICVIPYATWYGSPTKLFEYGASGKPVIGPRTGPIREILRDGENGVLTKVSDPEDLAQQILALARNPIFGKKLGIQLREEILLNYNWRRNTQKLINIFEAIKQNEPRPREKSTA